MKKPGIWQRLRYWFDNMMAKGTLSLLLLLGAITAFVAVTGGLLSVALGGADGSGESSTGHSIWFTLMHAINTGVLAKEEGTVPYLAVMTVVTLVGIFITSFLIGTISNAIKEKITQLQRGKSHVIETGHTVIIGFNENIISIIEELAEANANQQGATVVIMAEEDPLRMTETINDNALDIGGLRIVYRNGRPDSISDLKICSLETCKAVMVNLDDDFMTVKTILTCKNLLEEYKNEDAYITATIRDRGVLAPAKLAGGDRAAILNFQKTIARLMVQSVRHPGMSEVLKELLSFQGNEIYVDGLPEGAGLSLKDINLGLEDVTAIGLVQDGRPVLNCDKDTVMAKEDQLILIEQDDDPLHLGEPAPVEEALFAEESPVQDQAHTLLILGCTDMLPHILLEEDESSVAGSRVIIAVEPGRIDRNGLPGPDQLKNITVDIRECSIYKRDTLESLVAEKPSGIMLMSDTGLKEEDADARTLMLQLYLNDIAREIGEDIPLTIEMNNARNQRLSQMMRATDFVVSSSIIAKMMVQITEQRHNKAILDDLLSEGGSTIYMKPISKYVVVDKPVDFYTVGASAARYGEVAIGYKKYTDKGTFTIELNPASREKVSFLAQDDLIVIARNRF